MAPASGLGDGVWLDQLSPMYLRLFLRDKNDTMLDFTEVGSGLGYVLPVIVAVWHPRNGAYHLVYDDLDDLPLTAEERIDATPAEFVRVTNFLMLLSKELFFVDPYLNPCKQDVKVVMAELLALVARGQCGEIWIYARQSCVMGQRGFTWGEVCGTLDSLLSVVKPRRKLCIHYHLLDDEQSSDKMHARYAFSVRGGVRVDNGFQRLPRGRKTDVAPLSEPVLDELITMFAERADKLPIVNSYTKVIEP